MERLFLYLITPSEESGFSYDYDTYDSAIVSASSEEEACSIHPSGDDGHWKRTFGTRTWIDSPEKVTAVQIGISNVGYKGVVLSSFNAG